MSRKQEELNKEMATLSEVESSMKCTPTPEGGIRLQGISFLYKGYSRLDVSNLLNVTPATVGRWVSQFNKLGISAGKKVY